MKGSPWHSGQNNGDILCKDARKVIYELKVLVRYIAIIIYVLLCTI